MSATAITMNRRIAAYQPHDYPADCDATANRPTQRAVVLVVDDQPDSLALIGAVLGTDRYTLINALDGASALDRIRLLTPDLVLLDACMPGMDGFDVCRRMKTDRTMVDVPVIFMTGLTDSEDLVQGFRAGGDDYVTKPVRPEEIRVRVEAHLRRSLAQRQANVAVDAGGRGVAIVRGDGMLDWCSARARLLLHKYLQTGEGGQLPMAVLRWLNSPEAAQHAFDITQGSSRLSIRYSASGTPSGTDAGTIVTLSEQDDAASVDEFVSGFDLTRRQAEVLLWVARGKTNRDIAEILDMKPRTVNKHLEHVFPKLGVETRAAAANVALQAIG